MKILLTGATGQVGRALRPLLGALGEVVAPSRAEFDLARPESLRPYLRALKPALIVNPGAYTAVDRAEDEEALATVVNAEAPGAMAEEAAKLGAAFVQYSTDYVFDGAKAGAYAEDDPPAPAGAYGRSKLAGERAVAASGAAHLILRTSWVYDAEGANFMNTMLRLGAERDVLRVVADQVGAPTGANAIAEATVSILRQGMPDVAGFLRAKGGILNLCCAGATSWHGFAEAIFAGARARGVRLKVARVEAIATADYPVKAKRPANSRLDLKRLETRFGIEMPDWRVALDAALDRKFGPRGS